MKTMNYKLGNFQTANLSPSETLSVDSMEYIGNFLCMKGNPRQYLFDGGYLVLSNATFAPRYYIKDHLGNNRMAVNNLGEILQNTQYYALGGPTAHSTDQGFQRFKYNGKEYDPMHGLDEYDYGARQYDPAIGKFTSMDPLCEKYYHISPYAYYAENPVMYVDPDGKEPTPAEAARMSAFVYGDIKVKLTGNWKVSNRVIENFNPVDDKNGSGFKSMLFERTVDGKTEYTYALAGTDMSSWADWKNNAQQIVGMSEQYKMALDNADALMKGLNGAELTFTGHSLGGGMAAACAYSTSSKPKGGRALTFNPAGVSPLTIMPNRRANIDTYITYRDELKMVQNSILLLPSANGKVHHRLGDADWMGHSIKNFYEPSIYKRTYNAVKDKVIKGGKAIENALSPKNIWPF